MHHATAKPLVELSEVSKRFKSGTLALSDISLSVDAGEFVTLLGPSGCGKSTVLRMVAGLDSPSAGSVHAPALTTDKDSTAFVFQEATLMPWASVFDNVWLPLRLQGLSQRESKSRVFAALKSVGLEDFASSFPSQLSGGMRMRASITRALITDPKILLMDEPFGALDEITRHKLDAELLEIWRARKISVVFVTHSIHEAVFLSSRVVMMAARPGRIVDEFEITEPYPRSTDFMVTSQFARYAKQLQDSLHRASAEPVGNQNL